MDAVSAEEHCGAHALAVGEFGHDMVAAVMKAAQAMTEVKPLRRQRLRQHREEIGAVEMVIGGAEGRLELGERRVLKHASVVPAPLMDAPRAHRDHGERRRETEPMQKPRGIGSDLNASAHCRQGACLLEDLRIETRLAQRQRRGEAADAAADDRDVAGLHRAHGPMTAPKVTQVSPSKRERRS